MTQAAIIGAIRRGLRRGALTADQQAMLAGRMAAHPRHVVPARGALDAAGRVNLFADYIEREFGTVARLGGVDEIAQAVAVYLARQNLAAAITVSPHPVLRAVDFGGQPMVAARFGVCGPDDAVSLQYAFAGIAETGTLMLPSGAATPTTNNLLPDTAIVVVAAGRIAGCFEEAFDWLRAAGGMPRNVMLVTGPSRSADIEQTLELGAHGPRRLHVLIIDEAG